MKKQKNYSSIRLEVTSRCNLQCEYCHNSEYNNRTDDMTTGELMDLIRNIKEQYPINKILFTGGEPLLQKDICKLIELTTGLGIKADIITNGTLLTAQFIKKLESAGLKRMRISVDEIGEKSGLRTTVNPNTIWKNAKMVTDISDIEVCIHTVCSPTNVDELYEVYLKTLEIGAKRWRVFDIGYQGGITENKGKFNLHSYYNGLIESTKKILSHYIQNDLKDVLDIEINNVFRTAMLNVKYEEGKINLEQALKQKEDASPCDYVSNHQLSIRSNGEATLCQYFHNCIFDFKKAKFNVKEAICNQKEVIENELLMKDLSYCMKCKYCLVCNSGCRSKAMFLTGDILDADPSLCYLVPKIHNELIPLLPEETQKAYNSFINQNGMEPKYSEEILEAFLHSRGY